MNNIPFGNDLRASLQARGYKTAGERKAEEAAKQEQQPKQQDKPQDNNDKIAQDLGNRMLRDLGAFALNPVGGSIKFNQQLFKTMQNSLIGGRQGAGKLEEVKEEVKEEPVEEVKEEEKTEDTDNGEVIEYTYKSGDTFGQVIRDLGLESGNGLWGDNGDVAYYEKQLIDQGVWPDNTPHNIPIGTVIKLKQRPMTQEMIDYRKQYGYN